jgi:hypothetical protein
MPRLRTLSLRNSQTVGDEAVEELAGCGTLEGLDLRGSGVTARGLRLLAAMTLRHLDLRACHHISSTYQQYETRANSSAGLREVMQRVQA